jgi:hypothetical protein
MKKRKGLPRELELEVINVLVPIIRKYKDMKKSHMSYDRISSIIDEAALQARVQVYNEGREKGDPHGIYIP